MLKVYQNAGGTHPTTTYKAFDWDQAYRKPITYDTLWQADTDPLPVVFPIVQGELSKQTGQQVSIAPNAGLDPVNYQNFAVTNDGVIFFFNPGVAARSSRPNPGIGPTFRDRLDAGLDSRGPRGGHCADLGRRK